MMMHGDVVVLGIDIIAALIEQPDYQRPATTGKYLSTDWPKKEVNWLQIVTG